MKIYGIYDKEEQCRFVGTIKEIAEEFNCHRTAIYKAIERNSKFENKYDVVYLYKEEQ